MDKSRILDFNANQKYMEYLLYMYDNESQHITLGEIRGKMNEKFKVAPILLNQYFGLMRILPLVLIKEHYKNNRKKLEGDIKTIKIIRDSLAHGNFEIKGEVEKGYYIFKNDKHEVKMEFDEFNIFIHRIENQFYSE